MSGYLQRLFDRSAAPAPRQSGGTGRLAPHARPSMVSQSPVAAADQRLNDPSLAALIGATPQAGDQGPVEPVGEFVPPRPVARDRRNTARDHLVRRIGPVARQPSDPPDGLQPDQPTSPPPMPEGDREPETAEMPAHPVPVNPAVADDQGPSSPIEDMSALTASVEPSIPQPEPIRPAPPADPIPARAEPEATAESIVERDAPPIEPPPGEPATVVEFRETPVPAAPEPDAEQPDPAAEAPQRAEPPPKPEPPAPPPPEPETIIVRMHAPAPAPRPAEHREPESAPPETIQPPRPRPRTAAEASVIGALPHRRRVRTLFGVRRR